jgi:hypothetical protein
MRDETGVRFDAKFSGTEENTTIQPEEDVLVTPQLLLKMFRSRRSIEKSTSPSPEEKSQSVIVIS